MKAIIFDKKTKKILEIIENVQDYSEQHISGNTQIQGLSPNVEFLLVDDVAEISIDTDISKLADLKPDEDKRKKLAIIRDKRNELLTASDKYLIEDYPGMTTEKKKLIKEYRQQLRDITKNIDVDNPIWPVNPLA